MKNFPWIDKKISSIDLANLSHALIVEGQEGVGKNQICQFLINGLLNEKNSQNLIKNNSHPDLFCINNETLISYFQTNGIGILFCIYTLYSWIFIC